MSSGGRPRARNPLHLPTGLHRDKYGTFYYRGPTAEQPTKRVFVNIGKVSIEQARKRYAEITAFARPAPGCKPFRRFASNRPGFVYAMRADDTGHIKIGWSGTEAGILKRLSSVKVGCPFKVALIGYWPGTTHDELRAHKRLEKWRTCGEWFKPSADVKAFLRASIRTDNSVAELSVASDYISSENAFSGPKLTEWRTTYMRKIAALCQNGPMSS